MDPECPFVVNLTLEASLCILHFKHFAMSKSEAKGVEEVELELLKLASGDDVSHGALEENQRCRAPR